MKKFKIITFILMISILATIILSGCSRVEETQTKQEDSKNQIVEIITITDMAGRTVEIPSKIERIYCKNPIGTILMYTLAPDKLAGWNYEFTKNEKKYINEKYKQLPVLGGWFGKNNTGNIEEILKAAPDIMIDMGTINNTMIDADENIQQQTGIPVIIVDGEKLDGLDDAYTFIGKIIGEEKKAKALADYCNNTLNDALENAKRIDEEKRVKVYYAEGAEGLQTEPNGSYRTEVIRLVGGENVAEISQNSSSGRGGVSLEQVLLWNPDVIITAAESNKDNSTSFFETVYQNEDWEDINAVKNKKVYGIPQNPFGWFDRPPSVNRMIGIKWIGNALYPEIYKYDMVQEVKDFYKKFYHYDVSDKEAKEFLNMN